MRIAYDHQVFGWQKYGGISRYIYELAKNIAELTPHEVKIISPLYVNEYLCRPSPSLCVKGLRVPQIRKTQRIINAVNNVLSVPILTSFKPNIVHETYYTRLRHAPHGAKVVVTVYDMIHERFAELFPVCDMTAKNKAAAVSRADHVICISENTRLDLIDILGVDPAKTSVAHLGFSLTQPSADDSFTTDRPYLLYVGHRGGYKNFQSVLEAYAGSQDLMSNYDLLAFGGGGWRTTELDYARDLGIDRNRLRNVQGDDGKLAMLYRNASLFIYPSLYEGFGIPPLEAMSFGCPVVCSDASSLPEVVGDAAELFNPQSSSALLVAMERVLRDSGLCKSMVRRGYDRTQIFSWAKCAKQTVKIYESLLM